MSSHTALAELIAVLQIAGIAPDDVVKFSGALQTKPDLHDMARSVPHHERTRFLVEHGQQAALTRRNAGGWPR